MKKVGFGHLSESLTKKAVEMAVEARDSINPNALVMGCISTMEVCYRPELATYGISTIKKEHREQMTRILDAGADFLLLET